MVRICWSSRLQSKIRKKLGDRSSNIITRQDSIDSNKICQNGTRFPHWVRPNGAIKIVRLQKLHREAEKKFDEENNQEKIKDLHPTPDRFKAFTIGNRQLLCEKAKRSPSEYNISGYEGPAEVKEVDLSSLGQDPKPLFIATDLSHLEEKDLLILLREFRDCFAWTYKDMPGVPPRGLRAYYSNEIRCQTYLSKTVPYESQVLLHKFRRKLIN